MQGKKLTFKGGRWLQVLVCFGRESVIAVFANVAPKSNADETTQQLLFFEVNAKLKCGSPAAVGIL